MQKSLFTCRTSTRYMIYFGALFVRINARTLYPVHCAPVPGASIIQPSSVFFPVFLSLFLFFFSILSTIFALLLQLPPFFRTSDHIAGTSPPCPLRCMPSRFIATRGPVRVRYDACLQVLSLQEVQYGYLSAYNYWQNWRLPSTSLTSTSGRLQ